MGSRRCCLGMSGLALLVLAGCATVPAPVGLVSGRLAVQVGSFNGQAPRGLTAGFELTGSAETGELRLTQALGLQLAQASWSGHQVRLVTAAGESTYADVETLARDALGEPLPLRALPDWLRGRPWIGAAWAPRPGGFDQLGFTVDLRRWNEGRLEATRPGGADAPALQLRVLLDRPQ